LEIGNWKKTEISEILVEIIEVVEITDIVTND